MSSSFSPELTYIPRRHPHEIRDARAGTKLIDRIQRRVLDPLALHTGLAMHAKLDAFHFHPHTFCVEICPFTHFDLDWLDVKHSSHTAFMGAMDVLFDVLRDDYDLVPAVTTPARKGRPERHWPTGGGHVHMGADLFRVGTNWYTLMERFHRNLVMDFANRPYIRWLLAQWFDDENSTCLVTPWHFDPARPPEAREHFLNPDAIWSSAVGHQCHSIEPRFMSTSKSSYLTFEFRFIDAFRSPTEMRAVVLLLARWMDHVRCLTYSGQSLTLEITRNSLEAMGRVEEACTIVHSWLDSITFDTSLYHVLDDLFARNYANRIRSGQLV